MVISRMEVWEERESKEGKEKWKKTKQINKQKNPNKKSTAKEINKDG
jgi:hypothetical protein